MPIDELIVLCSLQGPLEPAGEHREERWEVSKHSVFSPYLVCLIIHTAYRMRTLVLLRSYASEQADTYGMSCTGLIVESSFWT